MRVIQNPQKSLGEIDIADIILNQKSRDDIPAILQGLQHIYVTEDLRDQVFEILEQLLPRRVGKTLTEKERNEKARADRGRPGMDLWKILVFGVLRLGLNADYDRIHDLSNQHKTIRQMLGHCDWDDCTEYSLQSIKDNLKLFTTEISDQINQVVINAGHQLVIKNPGADRTKANALQPGELKTQEKETLRGRCDSFVVETDVHHPTDLNLLYDAVRKSVECSEKLADRYDLGGWRQYKYHLRQIKKQYRKTQKLRSSNAKDTIKQATQEARIHVQVQSYIDMGRMLIEKSENTVQEALNVAIKYPLQIESLKYYHRCAYILMDQINRRIILDEKIPHNEKLFSIFEPHTEWISKGKAGVPVELGLRVCVMEDQHQFILHHMVMENQTDDKIALDMVLGSKERFEELKVASFDKGFHSPSNQKALKEQLDKVIMPKKGRLSEADKLHQSDPEFKQLRSQHSAVESAINALESHGLDRCLDHGIAGFKRYVALAVVARNIHRLGTIIRRQKEEKEKRKRGPYKKAA